MKLEAGKKYVLVSGQVVGPVWDIGDGTFKAMDRVDGFSPMWYSDGTPDFFFNPADNYPSHRVVKEFDESVKTL